jgi:hypothetical protein
MLLGKHTAVFFFLKKILFDGDFQGVRHPIAAGITPDQAIAEHSQQGVNQLALQCSIMFPFWSTPRSNSLNMPPFGTRSDHRSNLYFFEPS